MKPFSIPVIQASPKTLQDWLSEAKKLFNGGQHEEAMACLNEGLKVFRGNSELLMQKGHYKIALAEYVNASICFDEILSANPKDNIAAFYKAFSYYLMGEFEACLYYCDSLLKLFPDDLNALSFKASILFCQKRYAESDWWFDRIQKLSSPNILSLFVETVKHLQKGDEIAYNNAREAADKNIQKIAEPGICFYLFSLYGDMLSTISRLDIAKESYKKALELSPGFPYAKKRLKEVKRQIAYRTKQHIQFPENLVPFTRRMVNEKSYALIPAPADEIGKVLNSYLSHPVEGGYKINKIDLVYNPEQIAFFKQSAKLLNARGGRSAFQPSWDIQNSERKKIYERCEQLTNPFNDPTYPQVKFLFGWHGLKDVDSLDSIFTTGFANLGKTDKGFFGKGIYSTDNANYAYQVYSKGTMGESKILLLNSICFHSPYPISSAETLSDFFGKPSCGKYDANFAVVELAKGHAKSYVPVTDMSKLHKSPSEIVVFQSSQCIPRYLVQFSTNDQSSLNCNLYTFFKPESKMIADINLLDAANYVYQNFLKQPFPDTKNKVDSQYPAVPNIGEIVVYRPNHGLVFTLLSAFLVPEVVEYFVEHQNLSNALAQELRSKINQMQLGLLFHVIARKNEKNSKDPEREEAREIAAHERDQYMKSRGLIFPKDLYMKTADYCLTIQTICHDICLLRCLEPLIAHKKFENSIVPHIGIINFKQLKTLVFDCLKKVGNRIYGYSIYLYTSGNNKISEAKDLVQKKGRRILLIKFPDYHRLGFLNKNEQYAEVTIDPVKWANFLSWFQNMSDGIGIDPTPTQHNEVVKLLQSLNAHPDLYTYPFQDYCKNVFVEASTNVENCMSILQKAIMPKISGSLEIQPLIQKAKQEFKDNIVILSFDDLNQAKELQKSLANIGIMNTQIHENLGIISNQQNKDVKNAYIIKLTLDEYMAIMKDPQDEKSFKH